MDKLTKEEISFLKRLNTPIKIQDFLDSLPMNHEKIGETYMSPRRVLREKKAHCLEGALLACLCLSLQGEKPLILDLKAQTSDVDHVVALYRKNGYWGAISKTNHSSLRFRDPIYKTIRELALSYFHEYFLNSTGKKTLVSYSKPLNLNTLDDEWMTSENELWLLPKIIDDQVHTSLVSPRNKEFIRKADTMERKAGTLIEWTETDQRT